MCTCVHVYVHMHIYDICLCTGVHEQACMYMWRLVVDVRYLLSLSLFNKMFYSLTVPYIYIMNLNNFHPLLPFLKSPLLRLQFYSSKKIFLILLFLLFVHNPLSLVTASSMVGSYVMDQGQLFIGSTTE